ncbi:organic cation transporter protein-like [Saccoglossus kowalevskii]|uniref:Organic cation transporter protein-like n=1 Tax=Saccoglossus kowalevskii TaxID=10224 RepID=A0ABM0H118_SACKO|nr:PREDICTED: organic cation transporter protein-like [Saccoglossus kowalevskii]
MLHYDDVLRNILGEFGTYQKACFILVGIAAPLPLALVTLSPVFLFATTDSLCKVPEASEISKQICFNNTIGNCDLLVKNLTIPRINKDIGCGSVSVFDQCRRYNISYDDIAAYPETNIESFINNNETIKCDHGWEYDRSQYKLTVSHQFDLVCDRFYMNALPTSVYMFGMLAGSIIWGYVLDMFGRMTGFMVGNVLLIITGIIGAFPFNYVMFVVMRFFIPVSQYGVYLAGFVLVCEYVGPTKRTFTGMMYSSFFSAGYMVLAVYAYFIREWWILQLVTIVPNVIFLIYYWVVPESPRWLISVGRTKEAENIISRCARINKVDIPKDLFKQEWQNETKRDNTGDLNQTKYGCITLIRYPNLRKKTIILCYTWITITLIYYGISFDTSNLGGNVYLNMFISGVVEIAAYIFGIILMENSRIGRRWAHCSTLVFAGIACIALAFVPPCGGYVWLGITLAMLGKFGITSAFGMIYVYSAELFPTPLRSVGVGTCSMCARIGGILAPQLLLMGEVWKQLPPLVFGITSIVAGILIVFLPETRGVELPESIEEAEQFGNKYGIIQNNDPRKQNKGVNIVANEDNSVELNVL